MPHYLFTARYTGDSLRAMVQNPQDREAAARAMVESLGARLVCFYISFGEDDVVAIIEAADDTAMAAGALVIGASGAMSAAQTRRLFTGAEARAAMEQAASGVGVYAPPS